MMLLGPAQQAVLRATLEAAEELQLKVWVVGGVLRDLLLGREDPLRDIDLLVERESASLARLVSSRLGGEVREFPQFLTAKIVAPAGGAAIAEIDVAAARTEVYPRPGQLPVVQAASFEADLRRRDFTINALALPLGELLAWGTSTAGSSELRRSITDLFGGLTDLDQRCIRILHDQSFIDDPTRIFRAARYAVRIRGGVEAHTAECLRTAITGGVFATISVQRIFGEIRRTFADPGGARVVELLVDFGVLGAIPLFEEAGTREVLQRLAVLDGLDLNAGQRFELVLRIFYRAAGATRLARYEQFGFGRKQLRRFEVDTEPGSALQRSDQSLLYALTGPDPEAEVRTLARERGLLKAAE